MLWFLDCEEKPIGYRLTHMGILFILWCFPNTNTSVNVFTTVSETKYHALSHSHSPFWKSGNRMHFVIYLKHFFLQRTSSVVIWLENLLGLLCVLQRMRFKQMAPEDAVVTLNVGFYFNLRYPKMLGWNFTNLW